LARIGGRQIKLDLTTRSGRGDVSNARCVCGVCGSCAGQGAGVNRKAEPLRLGRPPVNTATERDIRKLRAKGMGVLEIASTPHTTAIDPKTGKPLAAKA